MDQLWLAVVVGLLQGVFEWLPISSEGNISLYLTVVEGLSPTAAVQFSLFLHAGTAVSALAYYRDELRGLSGLGAGVGRGGDASSAIPSERVFLAVATVISGVVAIGAYLALEEVASVLAGGAFVALIGVLLVLTGGLQRLATRSSAGSGAETGTETLGGRTDPDLTDALLVGVLQGIAVLPGVSRSGTTTGALLLRGHEGAGAFRLSFLLSIPAALGAGVLVVLDDGLPTLAPTAALLALVVSAVVGYLTIGALMRLVERVAFWGVCVGLGSLAIVGGVFVVLV